MCNQIKTDWLDDNTLQSAEDNLTLLNNKMTILNRALFGLYKYSCYPFELQQEISEELKYMNDFSTEILELTNDMLKSIDMIAEMRKLKRQGLNEDEIEAALKKKEIEAVLED